MSLSTVPSPHTTPASTETCSDGCRVQVRDRRDRHSVFLRGINLSDGDWSLACMFHFGHWPVRSTLVTGLYVPLWSLACMFHFGHWPACSSFLTLKGSSLCPQCVDIPNKPRLLWVCYFGLLVSYDNLLLRITCYLGLFISQNYFLFRITCYLGLLVT
jgi:hypothetical protein